MSQFEYVTVFVSMVVAFAVSEILAGFGRLIRTQEDQGAVAILDPRIRTKWYGSAFLRSLPDCVVEER